MTEKKINLSTYYLLKSLIDSEFGGVSGLKTTLNNKVNTSDIKNSLDSDDTNKPLSAKQGKELNNKFSNYLTTSGASAIYATKADMGEALNGKAALEHSHGNIDKNGAIANAASKNVVTDANGKITTENKPTIPTGSSTATDIKMNGTQSAGASSNFAKADHVHPIDTSRAASEHGHGNITNEGIISGAASKNVVTDADGKITTENKPTIPTYSVATPDTDGLMSSDDKLNFDDIYEYINSLEEEPVEITYTNGDTVTKRIIFLPDE